MQIGGADDVFAVDDLSLVLQMPRHVWKPTMEL